MCSKSAIAGSSYDGYVKCRYEITEFPKGSGGEAGYSRSVESSPFIVRIAKAGPRDGIVGKDMKDMEGGNGRDILKDMVVNATQHFSHPHSAVKSRTTGHKTFHKACG